MGTSLPLATLFPAPTVEQFADVIRRSKPPVFARPGVGGNVLGYFDLARLLGRSRPFDGLQARGFDDR
jgi:hypothetical protein